MKAKLQAGTALVGAIAYAASTRGGTFSSSTYWGIFFVGSVPGLLALNRANTSLLRAINQYNGVYSGSATGSSLYPNLSLGKDSLMLGWNWGF